LALLLSMWIVAPVRAVEPGASSAPEQRRAAREELKTTRAEIKETRTELKEDKCQMAEAKINFRLNQITENRDKHYETYQNMKQRMDGMITRWEGQGCNVSTLKTQRTQLETMLADFATAYRNLESSFQDTKQYQCGESQGKFVSAAQSARAKNQTLQQKALALRTYFINTIKPTLLSTIKTCKPGTN